MILAEKGYKNGHLGRIWPMYYRTTSCFLQGGPICPTENDARNRMMTNEPIFLYPSLPAQEEIVTAYGQPDRTSTDSKGVTQNLHYDRLRAKFSLLEGKLRSMILEAPK